MKKLKHIFIITMIFALALALIGCGNNDVLEGTYLSEDEPGVVLIFTGNNFSIATPFYQIDLPELDGELVLYGTFTVHERENLISFTLDEAALERDIRQAINDLFALDGDLQAILEELAEDPEILAEFYAVLEEYMEQEIATVLSDIVQETNELRMSFGNNFDTIYDEDTTWVRQ